MTSQPLLIINSSNMLHGQTEDVIKSMLADLDGVPIVYDMEAVRFITAYNALMFLTVARYIATTTGYRVCFTNLHTEVHAYLERIDFFHQANSWAYTDKKLPSHARYSRIRESNNLLEITHLSSSGVQASFVGRARTILSKWLPDNDPEIGRIVQVLSEICSNALDHSNDHGHVMIQSYRRPDFVEVNIMVVDLGIGITESLTRVHGQIASSDADYILRALEGYSAKGDGLGGAGLQFVQRHLAPRNGLLLIRSCKGLVTVKEDSEPATSKVFHLPGTQVSLKVRGIRS